MPWTEVGTFWISVVLAFITVNATLISYLIFRSQIDPEVVVYADVDETRPSIIVLIIENIGRGLAKDVTFELSAPLPEKAFGFNDAPVPKEMSYGPLISGIPSLGPGSKRIITWGQYGGLEKWLGDSVVLVTAKYRSDHRYLVGSKKHATVSPLDIKSFEGTDASDKNWGKKTSEQLEKIARTLEHVTSGFSSFKVEIREKQSNK